MPVLSMKHGIGRRLLHNIHMSLPGLSPDCCFRSVLSNDSLLESIFSLAASVAQSIDGKPSSVPLQAVKMAYSQCPSMDVLVPAILEHGPMVRTD